jgi:hypothetical protein
VRGIFLERISLSKKLWVKGRAPAWEPLVCIKILCCIPKLKLSSEQKSLLPTSNKIIQAVSNYFDLEKMPF